MRNGFTFGHAGVFAAALTVLLLFSPLDSHAQDSKGATPSYQSDFLKISVKSVSQSVDRKKLNLVLLFENVSEDKIRIALNDDELTSKQPVYKKYVLDDKGEMWTPATRPVGIESVPDKLCVKGRGYGGVQKKDFPPHYSLLTPKQIVPVLFAFQSNGDSKGKVFHFSANLCGQFADELVRFSAGLDNIKLPKSR